MARIAGVNIPDNKHAVISLTYIFGIGRTTAQKILEAVGIAPNTKVSQLDDTQLDAIRAFMQLRTHESGFYPVRLQVDQKH